MRPPFAGARAITVVPPLALKRQFRNTLPWFAAVFRVHVNGAARLELAVVEEDRTAAENRVAVAGDEAVGEVGRPFTCSASPDP